MSALSAAGSPIIIEHGAIDRISALIADRVRAHRIAIVTDTNVGPLYASRAASSLDDTACVITMAAGEVHKTRHTWSHVTDEMLAAGIGRDGAVIALGGGVVGDVGGFVAATYLRGIPVVQIPTSLVAMIDASIGGKTGVDIPAGKNLVGAFHAPALIVIDPSLLSSLPERELRGGLAEALKHGVIADAEYFARVARTPLRDVSQLVQRSVEIKSEIVNADPREHGRRKVLNFGHTLGHAIESASGYALRHGEAIAIGMVYEARLGERLGVTDKGAAAEIERALTALALPTHCDFDADNVLARTRTDKKVRRGEVEYALPRALGKFDEWTTRVADQDVRSVFTTD